MRIIIYNRKIREHLCYSCHLRSMTLVYTFSGITKGAR